MAFVKKTSYEEDISLVELMGYELEVVGLTINGVAMSDIDGGAKLRLSNDREILYIYLDVPNIWAGIIHTNQIRTMSFTRCEEFVEVEF